MKKFIYLLALLPAISWGAECTVEWTWDQASSDPKVGFIDGFKIYEKTRGLVAEVGPEVRSIVCTEYGIKPGDVLYAKSHVGGLDSVHSNEVEVQLKPPVVSVP